MTIKGCECNSQMQYLGKEIKENHNLEYVTTYYYECDDCGEETMEVVK